MALPGIQALLAFVMMVTAMFVRGTKLPSRGELVEQRLPSCRARSCVAQALPPTIVCATAFIVLPYDFRRR